MSDKRIRHLAVDREGIGSFVYYVDQVRKLPIDGKTVYRTITEIEFHEDGDDSHFKIYISDGAVAQEWINIPKTNKVTTEYFID